MNDISERKQVILRQTKIDAAYLGEYVSFGYSAPITVGECLHKALLDAHGRKAFGSVAHLQLRLFAEMNMCYETFGALLLAYSRWDKPGGILATLLGYRPGDVPKFIEKVKKEHDTLRLVCFPGKSDAWRYFKIDYSDEEIKKMILDTCDTYIKKNIHGAYNTIKHAGLPIRHPRILNPSAVQRIVSQKVYLTRYFYDTKSIEHICFKVTEKEALSMADNFLHEIRVSTHTSKELARFVLNCLVNDLLQPSLHSSEKWERELDKRMSDISEAVVGASKF